MYCLFITFAHCKIFIFHTQHTTFSDRYTLPALDWAQEVVFAAESSTADKTTEHPRNEETDIQVM